MFRTKQKKTVAARTEHAKLNHILSRASLRPGHDLKTEHLDGTGQTTLSLSLSLALVKTVKAGVAVVCFISIK